MAGGFVVREEFEVLFSRSGFRAMLYGNPDQILTDRVCLPHRLDRLVAEVWSVLPGLDCDPADWANYAVDCIGGSICRVGQVRVTALHDDGNGVVRLCVSLPVELR